MIRIGQKRYFGFPRRAERRLMRKGPVEPLTEPWSWALHLVAPWTPKPVCLLEPQPGSGESPPSRLSSFTDGTP